MIIQELVFEMWCGVNELDHFIFIVTRKKNLVLSNKLLIKAELPVVQKADIFSNKNSSFNWVHSLHMELMNASHSTNLFTNSNDHISTNGKALLHSHINLKHPTIPLLALTKGQCSKPFMVANSTFINLFDKTQFLFHSPTNIATQFLQKLEIQCPERPECGFEH